MSKDTPIKIRPSADEQISAFLANKPGVLADLCSALTERHINIRAMMVMDTVDVGTFRMLVDNVTIAQDVLRDAGAAYIVTPVITIPIPHKPGAFARIARALANAGVNIEYLYATAQQDSNLSIGVFRVSDPHGALDLEFEV